MPRPRDEVALEKLRRAKARVVALSAQLEGARLEAARVVLECQQAKVSRTKIAEIWSTNVNQIDRMLARARFEAR
jgi:hypothetical protein